MLNISKKFMAIILAAITLTACGREAQQASMAPQTAAPVPAVNGYLEIVFAKMDMQPNDFCDLYWEVKNSTKINFTDFAVDMIYRDAAGNIVDKGLFRDKVTPNGTTVAKIMQSHCSEIKSIEYVGVNNTTKVDGNYPSKISKEYEKSILSLPIKSTSKIEGVTVKSSGGAIAEITSAPATSQQAAPISNVKLSPLQMKAADVASLWDNADFAECAVTAALLKKSIEASPNDQQELDTANALAKQIQIVGDLKMAVGNLTSEQFEGLLKNAMSEIPKGEVWKPSRASGDWYKACLDNVHKVMNVAAEAQ